MKLHNQYYHNPNFASKFSIPFELEIVKKYPGTKKSAWIDDRFSLVRDFSVIRVPTMSNGSHSAICFSKFIPNLKFFLQDPHTLLADFHFSVLGP